MRKYLKIFFFGLLTWIVPFFFSFFFVDQQGNFLIPETFFKTIMIITGALIGVSLSVLYFRKSKEDYLFDGIVIGLIWLAINLCLDLVFVFAGFFKMSVLSYFTDIGLRYLSIPIFTIGLGYVLEKKQKV